MSLSSDSTHIAPVPESCQDPLDSLCWQLFDDVPVALLTLDQNLGLLSVNSRFQEMTGHRQRDLIGQPVGNLIRTNSGESSERFFRSVFSGSESSDNGEFQLWYAEGRLVPIDLRVNRVETECSRVLLCSLIDITERNRSRHALIDSQKRLREILDNTEAVVYVKDVEGRYQFVNRRFEELFNIRLDVLIGKYDYEIFPKTMAQDFRRNDVEVIDKGITIQVKEVAPHEDGPHLYLSSKFPLRDHSGQIYGIAGISTDITQMDRKEREVERLKTSLELILNSVSDGI
ncbi:MAG: PAS domain-containing protein, partial [Planctomycetes bacterium]|nr:PAS domain-containing protein [Planctomycetota bacterium]